MSRLAERFKQLRGRRVALVPYIVAADPAPEDTVGLMHALVAAGADIIELGVPFSDPMADGPVIQAACKRALSHGVMLVNVLDMVTEFRRRDNDTPVVLMGYTNPIEAMGAQKFIERAAQVGVDGVITVDLPLEEAQLMGMSGAFDHAGIDPIFLIAPNTPEQRVKSICAAGRGFLYYVSLKGITGAAHLDGGDVAEHVEIIRRHTPLPIGVGFGVKDAASAAIVATVADAVIVGSALVDVLAAYADNGGGEDCYAAAAAFLRPIRAALENGIAVKASVH